MFRVDTEPSFKERKERFAQLIYDFEEADLQEVQKNDFKTESLMSKSGFKACNEVFKF